jgi:dTMP kinase
MGNSFFLVLEGLDGSGKTEVARRLADVLRSSLGERLKHTFEPHDQSAAGDFIRQVLAKRITVSSRTLALAYALNRADHNERVIAPFFNAGDQRVIVCDRYYLSSLVYNSSPELPIEKVMELNSSARRPDLFLFLDASEETCYQRMGVRGGDRELFDDKLAEMRHRYAHAIAFLKDRGETIVTINADPGLLDVLNSIITVVNTHSPAWLNVQPISSLQET